MRDYQNRTTMSVSLGGDPSCVYCGVLIPDCDVEVIPSADDDAGWAAVGYYHDDDCQWVATRAMQLD